MYQRQETTLRELDRRIADGINVTLLWNPRTECVSVTVEDTRQDDSFEFEVEPGQALAAFWHPYAYAAHGHTDRWLAASAHARARTTDARTRQ